MFRGVGRFLLSFSNQIDMTSVSQPRPSDDSSGTNSSTKTPARAASRRGGRSEARPTPPTGRPDASQGAAFGRFLGIDAKSKNTAQKIDPETGEILGIFDPSAAVIQRFILQSVVRKLLPKSRTNNCLRVRAKHKPVWARDFIDQTIKVWKSKEHKKAFFSGLQTCGSVWQCPVCAPKIAERRRAEIIAVMAAHKAAGGCVNMLTLTCPHQRSDNLKLLLVKQAKALNSFWNDRQTKAIFVEMGVTGQIRALEVTHGRKSAHNNGWHPHYHVLLFAGVGVDLARFDAVNMKDWQVRLYLRWANACKLAGLGEPSYAHGLKLDDGSKAAQYVSKWGLEDEMTKGHTKKGKAGGETPFDLLRALVVDSTDKQAAALFIEFAETFKGKRQLYWSPGLKKRYAIDEKTDEQLADEKDDTAVVLGAITIDQWRDILADDGRGVVLNLASSQDWRAVSDYLESIKGRFKPKPA